MAKKEFTQTSKLRGEGKKDRVDKDVKEPGSQSQEPIKRNLVIDWLVYILLSLVS